MRFFISLLAASVALTATVGGGGAVLAVQVEEYASDNWFEGAQADICHGGALRPGATAFRAVILGEFLPGAPQGFRVGNNAVCRTVNNPNSACPTANSGVGAPPAYSTCWSAHASGAALDIFVNDQGVSAHTAAGDATAERLIDWLLETINGVAHYRARQLGVQEIIFGDSVWSSENAPDRTVHGWDQLDAQPPAEVLEHGNHVHITLNGRGAEGLVPGLAAERLLFAEEIYAATSGTVPGQITRNYHLDPGNYVLSGEVIFASQEYPE